MTYIATRKLIVVLAAVALATGVGACGKSKKSSSATTTTTAAVTTTAAPVDLTVQGFKFAALTVTAGGKINIVNKDSVPHTVTADDNSFDSGTVPASGTGSLTAPTKAGSFAIHCKIHANMHGTLVVQ